MDDALCHSPYRCYRGGGYKTCRSIKRRSDRQRRDRPHHYHLYQTIPRSFNCCAGRLFPFLSESFENQKFSDDTAVLRTADKERSWEGIRWPSLSDRPCELVLPNDLQGGWPTEAGHRTDRNGASRICLASPEIEDFWLANKASPCERGRTPEESALLVRLFTSVKNAT